MQFDAELLLLAMAPVFLACIGWEAWHLQRTRPAARLYSWRDTLCNSTLALMHQGADKLAWLYMFNTPSSHRVHHARNNRCIDRKYAGVLAIWDRLFGTYSKKIRSIRRRGPLPIMRRALGETRALAKRAECSTITPARISSDSREAQRKKAGTSGPMHRVEGGRKPFRMPLHRLRCASDAASVQHACNKRACLPDTYKRDRRY
jgi:hypothetical protein